MRQPLKIMLLFITIFLSDFYFNITIFACIGINFKIVFVQIFLRPIRVSAPFRLKMEIRMQLWSPSASGRGNIIKMGLILMMKPIMLLIGKK